MKQHYQLVRIMFAVVVLFVGAALRAQSPGNYSGRIIDAATGDPLSNVSVTVKGSSQGTQTDEGGNYSIRVTSGSVLVFGHVGYETVQMTAGVRMSMDVKLRPSQKGMNEVVIIGYGRQEKKDLTGSVGIVSQKEIRDLPVSSIDRKLVGQIPGVQISTITGTPGGGSRIEIRGAGSMGAGNDPLVVIDGIPLDNSFDHQTDPLNVVNPDDVETVTVLKDASSTAIYGSRGSNGVILITTKQGRKGTPRVDFSTYTGYQEVYKRGRPDVLNGREFAQFQHDKIVDDYASRGLVATDANIPAAYQHPEQYGEGTNWYNTILHRALQTNANLSISGASDNSKYYFSMGYFDQDGTIRYTGYKHYTMRANLETMLGKKIRIGINLAPQYNRQVVNDFESNAYQDVLISTSWISPLVPVTDSTGKRTMYISSPSTYGAANPLNKLQYAGTTKKDFRGLGTAFAEWEIIPGLKAKYSFSEDYREAKNFQFTPSFVPSAGNPPSSLTVVPSSSAPQSTTSTWLSELLLSYNRNFGGHHIDAVAGYSAQRQWYQSISISGSSYPDDLIQTTNTAGVVGASQSVQEWALISYLGRVNYSFLNRYMLTASVRTDGSSRFGANNRYGTFPSAALAWRFSEERFMKSFSWLSSGKLRASYGFTGNNDIGNYTAISTLSGANYAFGGVLAGGRSVTVLGNEDLRWERTGEFNAGLDLGFLKNRLSVTLDVYRRITQNMLYQLPLALSSGFATAYSNIGKIQNQGLELAVSSRNVTGRDFSWSTNANIAFNRNKVLALANGVTTLYNGATGNSQYSHITKVGKPMGLFWGWVFDGIYATQADLDKSPKNSTSVLGSVKYKDVDGNGVIEYQKDFDIIGDPHPDFTYGITNNFTYRNIDLAVVLVGSQGGQVEKAQNQYLLNIDGIFNPDKKVLNRWRSVDQPGDGKTPTTNGARVLYRDLNSTWIEDASYLRIQNVTLGYNFSPRLLGRTHFVKALRAYVSAQQLAIFTSYSGNNPEATRRTLRANAQNEAQISGEDFGNYPLSRTCTVGLNVTF
ncbi:TonB-dependent receptor [Flavitalea sp. BT771]|uniref:SusC/RagA family TonB-linked outer membrane protein n=1 Tax=Flavitalea sp. BT771 TaxID=3063329 RepID=UPI0026E44F58|nr:TonB-dependent receptor [Flavitalea sp. BT771]MDO6434908.1 TonB-dependent receptor [Flavitalea sp. BT771]MDV6223808.1 TonB-dependent receptor [Flavitalea sp. BT771]